MSVFGNFFRSFLGPLKEITFQGKDWSAGLLSAVLIGFIIVISYGSGISGGRMTAAIFLSGACLLVGVLFGFLFGVPRYLQLDEKPSNGSSPAAAAEQESARNTNDSKSVYQPNTNLEQISDWLTKILVGVGLTQLYNIPSIFDKISMYFGPSIGDATYGGPLAICLFLFFSVVGFLFGYLWTRLYFGGELQRADLESLKKQIVDARDEQSEIDAKALSLANQILSGQKFDVQTLLDLRRFITRASSPIKVQLFYQAREARRNWTSGEREKLTRTIPIFEALIESNPGQFHRNYGQLGYALKDSVPPEYAKAIEMLTKAIDIRGPADDFGYHIYELNRAICTLRTLSDLNVPTTVNIALHNKILDDIKVSSRSPFPFNHDVSISKWIEVNNAGISMPNAVEDTGNKEED